MKVLNLYAGIGGNRKLWRGCEVTAVEIDPEIAAIYRRHFPHDRVVVADAHQYLLNRHAAFDFIWSSPPCQSHSSLRQNLAVRYRGTPAMYPDMRLYQEVIFLKHNARCKWVVENVRPYYRPLIAPDFILQRHCFWSNLDVPPSRFDTDMLRSAQIPELSQSLGFDLSDEKVDNKRQVLRNCVNPLVGAYVFSFLPHRA